MSLAEDVVTDISIFRCALDGGNAEDAVTAYRGSFLEGFPFISEAFEDWRLEQAAWIEDEAVGSFTSLIAACAEREDYAGIATLAKRALLVRPHDEAFTRSRVEALAALGDTSRALRELDACRKRILIDTGTYPASLSDALAESIARIPLMTPPVQTPGVPTRLVGRSFELTQIRKHWNTPPHNSRITLLHGEPGIGKTRVLQHSLRRAAIEGARVFLYTCAEAESRLPYSGIVGLIRDGFREQDVVRVDKKWMNVLGALLPELFSEAQPAQYPQRVIWEAAAQYFGALAVRVPIALAVDNLHWLDDSSRDVLTYIMKRHPEMRLLFVGAGRAPLKPPTFEDDRPSTMLLELREISAEAVDELIKEFEAINNVQVGPRTREALARRVGGRPFFLLEALSYIKNSGRDFESGDVLPPNVASYLARRVSALTAPARSMACAIAVLDRDVPLGLLAIVAELSVVAASDALEELITLRIVADQPVPRFSHDLMRQAVTSSIAEPLLAAWHARSAEALATHNAAAHGEIAYHYEKAGETLKAYDSALRAAEISCASGAWANSEEHYVRALRCAPLHARSDVLGGYAWLLAKMGKLEAIYPYLNEIEALCRSASDSRLLTVCSLARFNLEETAGGIDPDVLLLHAKEILAMTERHAPEEITSVLWQVADCIRRSGEQDLLANFAVMLHERVSRKESHHESEFLSAAALLGGISIGYEYAEPLANKAIAAAACVPTGILTIRALFARGTTRLWAGKLGGAKSDFEAALECVETQTVGPLASSIKSNYSIVLLEQEMFDEAESMGLASLRESGVPRRGYSFGNLAIIKLRRHDWPAAKHYAHALRESYKSSPHQWIPAHVEALLGLAELGEGDITSASRRVGTLSNLTPDPGSLVDASHIALLCSRIDRLHGRTDVALSRLRMAFAALRDRDYVPAARLQLEIAATLYDLGQEAEAARELAEIERHAVANDLFALMTEIEVVRRNLC